MRLVQRGVRYLARHKKEVLAATVAGGLGLTAALALTGTITWPAALQTFAWGALALGTALALALLLRLDERTGDVRRAVFGGGSLLTAQEMADVAGRAQDARTRADALYEQGRMREAIDELVPYAAFDDEADLVRRRMMSERRALGPLTELPERATSAYEPVPGRVLHLVSNALPNSQVGYTVRTHRIVTAQRDAGLDPHVVTFPGWPIMAHCDTAPVREVDGIPYHRVRPGQHIRPGLQERIDAAITDVTALVHRLRPAVLHAASDHKNATVALHVGRALGIPVVYELRGFLEETWLSGGEATSRRGSERHHLLVERETSVLREADAVVTLAHTMRVEIARRGVDPERIVLAPNAVDTGLLEARPDGEAFRAEHGIAPDTLVIGSVSTLTHYEGFDTLIEAAAHLHEGGPPDPGPARRRRGRPPRTARPGPPPGPGEGLSAVRQGRPRPGAASPGRPRRDGRAPPGPPRVPPGDPAQTRRGHGAGHPRRGQRPSCPARAPRRRPRRDPRAARGPRRACRSRGRTRRGSRAAPAADQGRPGTGPGHPHLGP